MGTNGEGEGNTDLVFFCLRRGAVTPAGVGGLLLDTGGVAPLNPRLSAGIPPGWVSLCGKGQLTRGQLPLPFVACWRGQMI